MTVALIAESGIRLVDVEALLDEIRLPIMNPLPLAYAYTSASTAVPYPRPTYRRLVRMDDHTYVEKD